MRFLIIAFFCLPVTVIAQSFTFVTYNVENLFDADGISVYDDYKPVDRDGRPRYTPAHLLTKLNNIAAVMKKYNDGKGPDVVGFLEIEADQSPGNAWTRETFQKKFGRRKLTEMLKEPVSAEVMDLPAEWLLFKAFEENGLQGYDIAAVEPPMKEGKPDGSVKTALFSRLAIQHQKTTGHPLKDARPVLEVWLLHQGHEAVVFVNHWKSGSGNPKMEVIRVENGTVLRKRIDELAKSRPDLDIILMGDFNSDYNHATRYGFEETGINTKLKATGDEAAVSAAGAAALYNLWYELPAEGRKSDAYRNEWGTLMHLMINGRLYDKKGFQYVDNSFATGVFPGFNTLSWSGVPKRWSFGHNGSGYSDHFPLSARFTITAASDTAGRISLTNPSVTDDQTAGVNKVTYTIPAEGDYFSTEVLSNVATRASFMYQMFRIESAVSAAFEVTIAGEPFALFTQQFDFKKELADVAGTGKSVTIYGKLGQYRGKWQFVLDAPVHIVRQ